MRKKLILIFCFTSLYAFDSTENKWENYSINSFIDYLKLEPQVPVLIFKKPPVDWIDENKYNKVMKEENGKTIVSICYTLDETSLPPGYRRHKINPKNMHFKRTNIGYMYKETNTTLARALNKILELKNNKDNRRVNSQVR